MDNASEDPRNISDQSEEHNAEARGAQVELSPEEREEQIKSAAPDGGEIQELPDQPAAESERDEAHGEGGRAQNGSGRAENGSARAENGSEQSGSRVSV